MPKTKQQKAKDRERRVAKKKLAERQAAKDQTLQKKERDSALAASTMTSGVQKAKADSAEPVTKAVVKAR